MKKGNKTATAGMEEVKRNQCSADTLSHSSEDSLNYNTAFPSYFTTSTQCNHSHFIAFALVVSLHLLPNNFYWRRDHHQLLVVAFTPKFLSSSSELIDLSIYMSLSSHTSSVPPQEVPCPRAEQEGSLARSCRSSKTHSRSCCDFSCTVCNKETWQEWDDPFVWLP